MDFTSRTTKVAVASSSQTPRWGRERLQLLGKESEECTWSGCATEKKMGVILGFVSERHF